LQVKIAASVFIGELKVDSVDNSVLWLQSTDMPFIATVQPR
jgi:hypothetical protein